MSAARIDRRREVSLLVPLALVLLLVLSGYALLSHRTSLGLLIEERRADALRAAVALAVRIQAEPSRTEEELRRASRFALGVAVVEPDGSSRARAGNLESSSLLAPVGGRMPTESLVTGPGGSAPTRILAFAPVGTGSGRAVVRLDLDATVLASRQREMRALTVVVLSVDLAVLVVVLLFLRQFLAPLDRMLRRARELNTTPGEDELGNLVATFEKALATLATRSDPPDEIALLQGALSTKLESGLLLLDRHGRVVTLNPAGAALLAVEPPVEPVPMTELLAQHPRLVALLEPAVTAEASLQREECQTEGLTLGLSAHPLRRDDGALSGYLVLFADLTEAQRREGENRLAEGLAQLGELAAGVAHELRNSVATLSGYLSLVERRRDDGSLADYLGEIRREVSHLKRVVDDFLAFARPGTARVEEVDLAALARRVALDPALDAATVEVDLPSEPVPLRGDAQLLERALRNLVINAVEATRGADSKEPVCMGLTADGEQATLRIEDRGAGLPAEVRQRLFQPFVTGRAEGVGLGLALAHRIVRLHGGTLELIDREGGGTRALLTFSRVGVNE